MEFLNSAMQSSKLQRNSSIIDEKEVYRQLQAGLLKKELGRINASRMSDVLLLKNLVSEGESSAKNLLKQVIKECSLREESRAAREEQLFSLQGPVTGLLTVTEDSYNFRHNHVFITSYRSRGRD